MCNECQENGQENKYDYYKNCIPLELHLQWHAKLKKFCEIKAREIHKLISIVCKEECEASPGVSVQNQ